MTQFTSCSKDDEEEIYNHWCICYPLIIPIEVQDQYGNDLLDTAFVGNILTEKLPTVKDKYMERYSNVWQELDATLIYTHQKHEGELYNLWYCAKNSGYVYLKETDYNALIFNDYSEVVPENNEIVITWQDGTTDTLKVTNNGTYTEPNEKINVNGKDIPGWMSRLPIVIVKNR